MSKFKNTLDTNYIDVRNILRWLMKKTSPPSGEGKLFTLKHCKVYILTIIPWQLFASPLQQKAPMSMLLTHRSARLKIENILLQYSVSQAQLMTSSTISRRGSPMVPAIGFCSVIVSVTGWVIIHIHQDCCG